MIEVGEKAPSFTGKDQNGEKVSLKDFKGKKLAIFFYPKDDTPGCTKQACNLRDNWSDLLMHDISVVGISADSVESHGKFANKYDLPFSLVADTDKKRRSESRELVHFSADGLSISRGLTRRKHGSDPLRDPKAQTEGDHP